MFCALKTLGLCGRDPGRAWSEHPKSVLILWRAEKRISEELGTLSGRRAPWRPFARRIRTGQMLSIVSIADMDRMMEEAKILKKLHGEYVLAGGADDIAEWTTILSWSSGNLVAVCGLRGIAVVVALGIFFTRMYYRNKLYICPTAAQVQTGDARNVLGRHTPMDRLLTCTHLAEGLVCGDVRKAECKSPLNSIMGGGPIDAIDLT